MTDLFFYQGYLVGCLLSMSPRIYLHEPNPLSSQVPVQLLLLKDTVDISSDGLLMFLLAEIIFL